MPANWNSYSKSDTALNPRNIIVDLYFRQRDVVKLLKDKTFILCLLNFKSLKSELFINDTLSSAENKYSLV
jgi:hypothetical protein